ncbi:MAG TPA: ActS/PrrB/RegB family redox-sensitive histidine kinase, partial [Beijerinckiaceae bacterium]|nr:ActS/PrrB/RegB family redox-sensitive histidine kinase [Beijerinckiaceae bacterium]
MPPIAHTVFAQDARRLRLDTLVRLRWLAVIGQSAAVAGVHFGFGFPLPLWACFAVIAAAAALNLGLRLRYPASYRLGEDAATLLLGFDILQLAALLYLTGGLQNPFAMLFLAPVLISATALPPDRTLALGCLAVGSASILVLAHRPLPWAGPAPALPFLYVTGVWTAILLGVAFIGVYAWRVAEEARQLAEALAATERVLAREQHLSQLDGLAAAAAHELGTPLATIALVSREMEKALGNDPRFREDVTLLRSQSERCREILKRLNSLSSEMDTPLMRLPLSSMIEEVV